MPPPRKPRPCPATVAQAEPSGDSSGGQGTVGKVLTGSQWLCCGHSSAPQVSQGHSTLLNLRKQTDRVPPASWSRQSCAGNLPERGRLAVRTRLSHPPASSREKKGGEGGWPERETSMCSPSPYMPNTGLLSSPSPPRSPSGNCPEVRRRDSCVTLSREAKVDRGGKGGSWRLRSANIKKTS